MTNWLMKLPPHRLAQFVLGNLVLFWVLVFWSLLSWIGESDEKQTIVVEAVPPAEITLEQVEPPPQPEEDERFITDEYTCLALNIYHESRGDSLAGRVAVADVVLNRMESEHYPNTVCDVVQQAVWIENWKGNMVPKRHMCQFSWFCDGLSDEPKNIQAWLDAYALAMDVYDKGVFRGVTERATHYHALSIRPNWAQDRGMNYTGTIGQHEFYRWDR